MFIFILDLENGFEWGSLGSFLYVFEFFLGVCGYERRGDFWVLDGRSWGRREVVFSG